MKHLAGLLILIPISEMLMVSFFVLFAISKTSSKALKRFGYVVCALIWIATSLLVAKGVLKVVRKHSPAVCEMMRKIGGCDKMKGDMGQKMHEMKKGCEKQSVK